MVGVLPARQAPSSQRLGRISWASIPNRRRVLSKCRERRAGKSDKRRSIGGKIIRRARRSLR